MSLQFYDRVTPRNVRHTKDGYLVADAPVARTGVQIYRGAELDRPDMAYVRVYRPESEVFSQDAMNSYAHRPMTNDHPGEMVTADNWKGVAIGQTGDEIVRDGQTVRVPLVMMDKAAITDFEGGKRELSMGYTAIIDWSPGITEDGQDYDAVQRELRMNHLALVNKGRAGNARIGDRLAPQVEPTKGKEGHSMADNLRTVVVDGLSVSTTDQGAEAISKLQRQIQDGEQGLADAKAQHADAIAAKDKELAQKDAEIEKLKEAQLSDEQIDQRVADRAELLSNAKLLNDVDYKGKSDNEIRSAVVAAKFGDAAVTDKSEAYIEARFDTLVEALDKQPDQVRASIAANQQQKPVVDADSAYDDYVKSLADGSYYAKKEG